VIGEPTRKQEELFNVVKQIHEQLLIAAKPGISGAALYNIGYDIARDHGFAGLSANSV
jgi:Xaa-Pro aminopeptidase